MRWIADRNKGRPYFTGPTIPAKSNFGVRYLSALLPFATCHDCELVKSNERGVKPPRTKALTGQRTPKQLSGVHEMCSLIGAGGMGEVYLVHGTQLPPDCAKVLPADFTQDEDRLRRFEQEVYAASGLNYPNILISK